MTRKRKARQRRADDPNAVGAAAKEATGQIPTGPDPSAEKARKESGQGPARGVGERKER